MAVPHKNQLILGGYFFEEIVLGSHTLTCSMSNNVYIGYLKDDEWLNSRVLPQDAEPEVFPNPFSQTFRLINHEEILSVKIFNSSSVLMESYDDEGVPQMMGACWPKGVYIIRVILKSGQVSSYKALKI